MYEEHQPPLEMLRLEAERNEASKLLAQTGRKVPYPGVTHLMLRSVSAGVMRFGGSTRNDPSQALPLEPRLLSTAGSTQRKRGPMMQFRPDTMRPLVGTSPDQQFFDPNAFKSKDEDEDEDEKKDDYLAMPSEEPDPEPALVQKLTSQCNNLAWRLVALEQELEQYRAEAAEEPPNPFINLHETASRPPSQATLRATSRQGGSRSSSPNRGERKAAKLDENEEEEKKKPLHPKLLPIEKSKNKLTELVTSLTKSLYGDDKAKSEEKEMTDALRAHAREQKRLEEYNAAKIEWKRMHTGELQVVLKMEVERQKKMEEKVEAFKNMLMNKKRQVFLQGWHGVMKENLQDRKRLLASAMDMENRHFNTVLLSILKGWYHAAHGPYSRKGVMERHRIRMTDERTKLEVKLKARGEGVGLITKEMLVDEMRKTVVHKLEKQRQIRSMYNVLGSLSLAVQIAEDNNRASIKHYKNRVMRGAFSPWAEWAFLNSQGLDRACWKAPGQLIVRYNQTAVDAFSDRRVKKLFFNLWKPVAQRYVAAKKMRRRNISKFASRHIQEWKYVAIVQRNLLKFAVGEWKAYSRRLMESPFRMWFVWMDRRKRKRADQDRLITAYMRTKHRKFLWNIVRGWRHQAVYGRIAGLYSRNDLMKSLTEQKQQCKLMEQEMATYVNNVNEMNKLLEANTKRVKDMEIVVQKKENKARELRMAMHHCEQEMVKMQSLVESVQKVHPVVAKHIKDLQGEQFNFNFRGLNALVVLRKSEEDATGIETVLLDKEIAAEEFDDDGLLFKDDGSSVHVTDADMEAEMEGVEGLDGDKTAANALVAEEPAADSATGASPAAATFADKATNDRLQFVLGKVDYRSVLKIGGASLMPPPKPAEVGLEGEAGTEGEATAPKTILDEAVNEEQLSAEETEVVNSHVLADEVMTLYGLIEFLRSGDTEALAGSDKGEWIESQKTPEEKEQDAKEKVEKEEEERRKHGWWEKLEGHGPDGEAAPIGEEKEHDPDRKWKHLTNPATITGDPYKWKDFLFAINRRLPKDRKTGTVQDKVMNRISASKERNEHMIMAATLHNRTAGHRANGGNDDDHKNLYTGKDFDDTFKPQTPRGFGL